MLELMGLLVTLWVALAALSLVFPVLFWPVIVAGIAVLFAGVAAVSRMRD